MALVGMPNTGKSTLFNHLTGGAARIANWPGLTVEITTGRALLGKYLVHVADLPGIYDLEGGAEDERLAHAFLAETPLDAVLLVLNATQLDRQLGLALQLAALDVPLIVALNMADEARRAGIQIDREGLSARLGCPVVAISAKRGEGIPELKHLLGQHLQNVKPHCADFSRVTTSSDWHAEEAELHGRFVRQPATLNESHSARLDSWVLHPWLGLPLFIWLCLN